MSALINMAGMTVGRWTVIGRGSQSRLWACRCACGSFREVSGSALMRGKTLSCGCNRSEKTTIHGHAKNGMSRTYKSWHCMLQRCSNQKNTKYKNHGGRGISVCDAWRSFPQFLSDMGERPPEKSLDRVDNSLGYSKSNCRWATRSEQGLNCRHNRIVELHGVSKPLTAWARELGIHPETLRSRLRYGWSVERTLTRL